MKTQQPISAAVSADEKLYAKSQNQNWNGKDILTH